MRKNLIWYVFAATLGVNAQNPTVSGVQNAASFSSRVSPGTIVTILGSNLGGTLADTTVTVSGLNAPILFVSDSQINVQLPYDLPFGPTTLRVTVHGKLAPETSLLVDDYAPAVLTANGIGTGIGIFTNARGLLTPFSTATPGETTTVYVVGLGATNPRVAAGTQAPTTQLPQCATTPTLTIGGVAAKVESASLSPGLAGVYQVSFVVPDVGPGDQDVVISIGGVDSTKVTLPVGTMFANAIRRDTNGQAQILKTAPSTEGNAERFFDNGPSEQPIIAGAAAATTVQRLNLNPGGKSSAGSLNTLSLATNPKLGSPQVSTSSISGGITYTCDATVTAVAGVCSTLNTTIASLYSSAFTNASANIYIQFGNTGLGESVTALNLLSYGSFRSALIAAETDADDVTAVTHSVPSANPFGTDVVTLTNANARALGFASTSGFRSDGSTFCTIGTADCYDGVITISSSVHAAGEFYFRSGSIAFNQYDFYTVVEHETDEILGTASCAFVCNFSGTMAFSPPDLFRYHSSGSRSFAAGDNNSCSSVDSGNACFSIDGVNMLQQYNNVDNGEDAGDWAPNCATPRVQNSEGCPGAAGIDISPSAEIKVLDVSGFTTTSSASSLAGYWKLDESVGATSFVDSSGHGNTGTCSGSGCPTMGVAGKVGTAASFNGNQILIPDSSSLRLNQFTVALWVFPTQVKSNYQPLVVKEDSAGNNRNYGVFLAPNTLEVRYAVWASDCATKFAANSVGQLTLGVWNHIAFTYDGNTEKLYLNGVLDNSNAAPTSSLCQAAVPVKLGMETSAFLPFSGILDEVHIYSNALGAAAVGGLYNVP